MGLRDVRALPIPPLSSKALETLEAVSLRACPGDIAALTDPGFHPRLCHCNLGPHGAFPPQREMGVFDVIANFLHVFQSSRKWCCRIA